METTHGASRTYMVPQETILTQMRNSLYRRTINNRDKGFMVARETAAIKVSGLFPICQLSVPPSRSGPKQLARAVVPFSTCCSRPRVASRILTAMESALHHTLQLANIACAGNHGIANAFRIETHSC